MFHFVSVRKALLKRMRKTKLNLRPLSICQTGRSDRPVGKWNALVMKTDRTGSGRTGPVLLHVLVGSVSFHAPVRTTREMRGSFESSNFESLLQFRH